MLSLGMAVILFTSLHSLPPRSGPLWGHSPTPGYNPREGLSPSPLLIFTTSFIAFYKARERTSRPGGWTPHSHLLPLTLKAHPSDPTGGSPCRCQKLGEPELPDPPPLTITTRALNTLSRYLPPLHAPSVLGVDSAHQSLPDPFPPPSNLQAQRVRWPPELRFRGTVA